VEGVWGGLSSDENPEPPNSAHIGRRSQIFNKKAVLLQRNRAMPL